jgi:hypothetical protein
MTPYSAEGPRAFASSAKMPPPPRRVVPALPLAYEKRPKAKLVNSTVAPPPQRAATPDESSNNSAVSSPQNGIIEQASTGAVPMTPESIVSNTADTAIPTMDAENDDHPAESDLAPRSFSASVHKSEQPLTSAPYSNNNPPHTCKYISMLD